MTLHEHMVFCPSCIQPAPMPPKKPPVAWPETDERWSRLHCIDFAGPIDGHMLLIVVDSHSKWIEAIPIESPTTHATVEALRTLFSTFGLPRTLVSDNGPQFTSWEFHNFMKLNNIPANSTVSPPVQWARGAGCAYCQVFFEEECARVTENPPARILHRHRRTPQAGLRFSLQAGQRSVHSALTS